MSYDFMPPDDSRRLSEWLEQVGPDEWHQLAQGWHYDRGLKHINWIVSQPLCDRATAQHVFWDNDPTSMLKSTSADDAEQKGNKFSRDQYELVELVLRRWTEGSYVRAELGINLGRFCFNPHIAKETAELSAEHATMKIPQSLYEPVNGRVLDSSLLMDGLPLGF